jgi:hypothetical protein
MNAELEELFPRGPGMVLPVRILKRHGRMQLALPSGRAAAPALELYAAQRPFAVMLKRGLQFCARLGLPLPLSRGRIVLAESDPFSGYLRGIAAARAGPFSLGVCAGNPRAPGRRWLIAVFSGAEPLAVVKAGTTPEARVLIERESSSPIAFGPPFASERLAAFAMPFVAGRSPSARDLPAVISLLTRWLRADERVPIASLPAWQRLATAVTLPSSLEKLAALEVAPALAHGDFAPWNIRIPPGGREPVALDWERSEPRGLPLWDLLHFAIQPMVLVRRDPAPQIVAEIERLLESEPARRYLAAAGVTGCERPLTWAYVWSCCSVQRQTEGAEAMEALLALYAAQPSSR